MREYADTLIALLGPERGKLPSESTLRRALRDLDPTQPQARLSQLAIGGAREDGDGRLRGQSMDGKQVRGCEAHGRPMHLLGMARHEDGAVLARVEVDSKENEIVAAPQLLKGPALVGTVTTMDGMLTQRKIALQIRS